MSFINLRLWALIALFITLLFSLLTIITQDLVISNIINQYYLDLWVSIDLLFTVPFIFWLCIRKTNIPILTVVIISIIGLMIGYQILPSANQWFLNHFKVWVLPFAEGCILLYVLLKLRSMLSSHQKKTSDTQSTYQIWLSLFKKKFPKPIAPLLATEVTVLHYAFFSWKKVDKKSNEFSYHQTSGIWGIAGIFILLGFVDAVVVHLIVAEWSSTLSYVLTGFAIYMLIFTFSALKSMIHSPIIINENRISLFYGFLKEANIDINHIQSVEIIPGYLELEPSFKTLSPLAFWEGYNIVIHTHGTNEINGIYGYQQHFTKIAFYVDDPQGFKSLIDLKLGVKG